MSKLGDKLIKAANECGDVELRGAVLRILEGIEPRLPTDEARKVNPSAGKFDRLAYQREYMRKRRAKLRAKNDKL